MSSVSGGCVSVAFQIILPSLDIWGLCVSVFRHELRELQTNSRFHNVGFEELLKHPPFRTEQALLKT